MRPARRAHFLLSATAAAAVALTGCMANVSSETTGTTSPPAVQPSASASPTTTAPTTVPPTTAPPAASPGGTTTTAPAPAAPVTFTFPDGRLSFDHPADWRVEVFEASKSPYVGTATVYDADGSQQVSIYYGQIADGVGTNATRTVLDTVPVPGLQGKSDPPAHASFFVDRVDGSATYRMQLTAGGPTAAGEPAVNGLIQLDGRVLTADVLFIDQPFASDEAARAWLGGSEGQALKALLTSFSFR